MFRTLRHCRLSLRYEPADGSEIARSARPTGNRGLLVITLGSAGRSKIEIELRQSNACWRFGRVLPISSGIDPGEATRRAIKRALNLARWKSG